MQQHLQFLGIFRVPIQLILGIWHQP